jgi:mRNA interferase MazF
VAGFVSGDVVVLAYPFSDFTELKRRPALVIAQLPRGDVLLCQITSQTHGDPDAVPLKAEDFHEGRLSRPSWVRPGRLFAAESNVIEYRVGCVKPTMLSAVVDQIVKIVRGADDGDTV